MIDKNIPVYILYIHSNVSYYYVARTTKSFIDTGYSNLFPISGITPGIMGNTDLIFNNRRIYPNMSGREWLPEEKAIWESHYILWHKCIYANKPIIIAEHDCYMERPLPALVEKYDIFSFVKTGKNRSIPAVGYYLTPHAARKLIARAQTKPIESPVDGLIHSIQLKRMPFEFTQDYIDKYIYASHYINDDIGTSKPTIGKKNEL